MDTNISNLTYLEIIELIHDLLEELELRQMQDTN